MHPCWQLLERHHTELTDTQVLWLDPPEPNAIIKANDYCITSNRALHAARQEQWLAPDADWPNGTEHIVVFYPKAKGRLEWWLHQVQQQAPKARLWIVGENLGGIKSLPKRLNDWAECEKVDNARHCVLFEVRFEHAKTDAQDWLSFDWNQHRIHALPGVFSQNRLDTGTAVLLAQLPALNGQLLELGCGSGVLSLALLLRDDSAKLTTVDIDWLAVTSTKRTLTEAGLADRVDVQWSDGLADVTPHRFDHLITNPPFHTGLRTHYEPSERFFAASHEWLKPGGSLWWVANDFLDYQRVLKAGAFDVNQVAHERGFRVFEAKRRR
ncbi:class I SAM-dependent methyltransferase [Saccharospirillum mangrovi]|uniref:class I SAM-dependent methyltransferase n=1 Tax=Saccharospirillum mangrovi TaxID=2161747 RepID=UPI000D39333F|nr:class I SAM-dependent methyltransferase [Saccharospirillum mangrovi]